MQPNFDGARYLRASVRWSSRSLRAEKIVTACVAFGVIKRFLEIMNKTGNTLLKVSNLDKSFVVGAQTIEVLKGINLTIDKGDFAIIFGPSGCGKSTLLHSILGMEPPTRGEVVVDGVDLYKMDEDGVVTFRKSRVGVVFQQPIWVKSLNVIENVNLPNRLRGWNEERSREASLATLKEVKLEAWSNHHPLELSSGQQQRVSLARALTIDPVVLVADEPTGNLDTASGEELMELLRKLNKEKGKTILMVTHDLEYLKYANRLFHVIDGKVVDEYNESEAGELANRLKSKKSNGHRAADAVRSGDYLEVNGNGKNGQH